MVSSDRRSKGMFSRLLITVVVAPVVFGMIAARSRRAGDRLLRLLALVAAYDILYVFLLYYLRGRWLGG